MADDSSSRKEYPVNALIVASALVVLGVGLGTISTLWLTKDGDRPEQDSVAVEAPRAAPQPAPSNLPPVSVRRVPSWMGSGYGLVFQNNGTHTLSGMKYRTWNGKTKEPWCDWIPIVAPMAPGDGMSTDAAPLPNGLPIFPGDSVELWVPGYDVSYYAW